MGTGSRQLIASLLFKGGGHNGARIQVVKRAREHAQQTVGRRRHILRIINQDITQNFPFM